MAEQINEAVYCATCSQRLIPIEGRYDRYRHASRDSDLSHAATPKQIKGTVRPNKLG